MNYVRVLIVNIVHFDLRRKTVIFTSKFEFPSRCEQEKEYYQIRREQVRSYVTQWTDELPRAYQKILSEGTTGEQGRYQKYI